MVLILLVGIVLPFSGLGFLTLCLVLAEWCLGTAMEACHKSSLQWNRGIWRRRVIALLVDRYFIGPQVPSIDKILRTDLVQYIF